jgi:2-keto-4-pentenoate hydratase/2-oxohepta-3-ene-1,7-dioic acid hydratase in catechol pathway
VRLATILDRSRTRVAVVHGDGVLPLPAQFRSVRAIAARSEQTLREIASWADRQPADAYLSLEALELAPAVPDPGAIYTIGLNYRPAHTAGDGPDAGRLERPLVYGKAAASVAGNRTVVTWDRTLTANVDAECELGVVMGAGGRVFGYTIIDDVSSRDPWLDGDQWLLGKSMPGFCPVGPWIVTADELDPADLRLGCTIDGVPIQDGRTSQMRFSIPEIIAYLGRHLTLRPGDLIATGTPERLPGPLGPDRHLRAGDTVTCWVEGIGELTNTIA